LCRASTTSLHFRKQDVDGRDKPGRDVGEKASRPTHRCATLLAMRSKERPARATRGNSDDRSNVLVARFGAAHGVRGEVKLWSFTADPLAVADYGPLESKDGERQFVIAALRPAKDFLVARIEGVNDRSAAEALRNVELYVPRGRLPAIDEDDTWYYADLVGLAAVAPEGTAVGTVTAVHNFGAGDIIEIAPNGGGKTLLLPFTETTVPEVNVKVGRIVVMLPSEIEGGAERAASSSLPLRGMSVPKAPGGG
jgi:16S rRNA processing protein RimM